MLWEISVLNKIYKTNAFSRIKHRINTTTGKPFYVITNDTKFSSVITEVQPDDFQPNKTDTDLIEKYNLQ